MTSQNIKIQTQIAAFNQSSSSSSMELEIEVPSHFLCPISMQPMKDPVTISTGITYDRESIQRWLFTSQKTICPVTKQPLFTIDLIPNHTLRRLIHSWCTNNSHHGLDLDLDMDLTLMTPKKPVDKFQIVMMLNDVKRHPQNTIKCLRRMRSIAVQASDHTSKLLTCMEDSVVFEFLMKVITEENVSAFAVSEACDEALMVLHHLQHTGIMMNLQKLVVDSGNGLGLGLGLLSALSHVMRFGSLQSRSHAITLLRSLFKVMDPSQYIAPEVFTDTIRIMKHNNVSQGTIKAALELVVETVRWSRNRIKAAESGMVSVLIELLIEHSERRTCELGLVALEQICRCAEGRAKLVEHAAGLATVSKKILRVSHVGSDRAVRILCLVSRLCGSDGVVEEMVEVGVVSKLCLMIQIDCSERMKERVKGILMLHSRVWKDANCIPAHLLSSYPC